MEIKPFSIAIPQAALDDLHERLAHTRWPDEEQDSGWDNGTNLDYMKELCDYWQNKYDWRAQEAKLNQFPQYRAEIDGTHIHFIQANGKGPKPKPIIITHGWPGSFFEIVKLIPLLTDPARFGGDPADSFDVIIPSLPGYGFSDRPPQRGGMLRHRAATLWAKLMTDGLGYTRFGAAGGDIGASVTQFLAMDHPELLTGIHLTLISAHVSGPMPSDLSEAEKSFLSKVQQWNAREGAYYMIHSTKPETLSFGLNDSPVGLAAWITEKFRTWMDCDGVIEKRVSKDDLLTNIMIYWLTQTISSSIRSYANQEPVKMGRLSHVPAAFASFPKDLNPPPREWVERRLKLMQWTEMPRGGHFAAMEEPELLAEDLRKFFRTL
ncbi:MAG: epoxide hydrolase [Negativicutes bacterium]|nr:epoxide hydrolase [Negativicutes bacterium]